MWSGCAISKFLPLVNNNKCKLDKKMNIIIKYPTPLNKFKLGFVVILFLIFTTNMKLIATTITVKQDGTGHYTVIQDAIDDSNNGDTVLVWPGTYYENLVIDERNIVLGSLTLTTGDNTYMY